MALGKGLAGVPSEVRRRSQPVGKMESSERARWKEGMFSYSMPFGFFLELAYFWRSSFESEDAWQKWSRLVLGFGFLGCLMGFLGFS